MNDVSAFNFGKLPNLQIGDSLQPKLMILELTHVIYLIIIIDRDLFYPLSFIDQSSLQDDSAFFISET